MKESKSPAQRAACIWRLAWALLAQSCNIAACHKPGLWKEVAARSMEGGGSQVHFMDLRSSLSFASFVLVPGRHLKGDSKRSGIGMNIIARTCEIRTDAILSELYQTSVFRPQCRRKRSRSLYKRTQKTWPLSVQLENVFLVMSKLSLQCLKIVKCLLTSLGRSLVSAAVIFQCEACLVWFLGASRFLHF